MIARFRNYYRVWRSRGAAKLDHGLWFHWALFGKYPASTIAAFRGFLAKIGSDA